ncbi:unnamed protein product [Cyclocybe aegerita]|uniref:Uncharacterized protein n=1 Tax=Cyclocybe aegerita TaxID=1973307 RepID=A0A8S0VSC4_CYCAE|nr:unnamed protein product [Cyclocybe aegerita]
MSLLGDHAIGVLSDLEAKCEEVWYSPTTGTKQVYSKDSRIGEKTIVALVKCTRCEDKFLPPPDKVEELKVFAEQGFTEQLGCHQCIIMFHSTTVLPPSLDFGFFCF